jgi:phosphoglycolate phosphatase-like HAD superfamily hydrolase
MQAVIFDLEGTLVDAGALSARAYGRAITSCVPTCVGRTSPYSRKSRSPIRSGRRPRISCAGSACGNRRYATPGRRVTCLPGLVEQLRDAKLPKDATRTARTLVAAGTTLKALRRRCRVRVKDDGAVEVTLTVPKASKRS